MEKNCTTLRTRELEQLRTSLPEEYCNPPQLSSDFTYYRTSTHRFNRPSATLLRKFLLPPTNIDKFIRWPEVIPLPKMTAETVARAFVRHWIARFGVPVNVTKDQGERKNRTRARDESCNQRFHATIICVRLKYYQNLQSCSHVWLRIDAVRPSLTPPYDGPFRVIEHQSIIISIKVRTDDCDRRRSIVCKPHTWTHPKNQLR
uniref:Integrase catalytic domain-containing protein n=1 Tax=Anopheles dirus TaxID=7168 RepID=A0A182N2E7_9DIPT